MPSKLRDRFTNREKQLAIFQSHLDAKKGPCPALMFYGMGGIGKSWLMAKLRESLIGPSEVPVVHIDYTMEHGNNRFRGDSVAVLLEVRRLTDNHCPQFDLALTVVQFRRHRIDEGAMYRAANQNAGEFWGWAKTTLDAIGVSAAFSFITGSFADNPAVQDTKARLFPEVTRLMNMDLAALEGELGARLAADLSDPEVLPPSRSNRGVQAVVFVDTLEALFPIGLDQVGVQRASYLLRELISALRERVLFVLAGQNRLNWQFLHSDWGKPEWLAQYPLDGFSATDARGFLSHCQLSQADVQDAILDKCLEVDANGGYHPASLGLFADIGWLELRAGRTPTPALFADVDKVDDMASLVLRFLKSLPSAADQRWILLLAVTPRFDEAAARAMHSATWSAAQDVAIEMLSGLSFIIPSSTESGWYSVDSSVQDALQHTGEVTNVWHEQWRAYWKSRVNHPLEWFHHWRLSPNTARITWQQSAERRRSERAMTEHHTMLFWWEPTRIETRRPKDWEAAASLVVLGIELTRGTLGNRSDSLHRAMNCFRLALEVYTPEVFPFDWAATQSNLGIVYGELPGGNRDQNLHEAISCFKRALTIYTPTTLPLDWAMTKNNLGNAYASLPNSDTDQNLHTAIACIEEALQILSCEANPDMWAMAQNNLGIAYRSLRYGDHDESLHRAISCYLRALQVRTFEARPSDWATTLNNLGNVYGDLREGDREVHLRNAINCYQLALKVRTREAFPFAWAMTQNNLGLAYASLRKGDLRQNLQAGIRCQQLALEVYTADASPAYWAASTFNMGLGYVDLAEIASEAGEERQNLHRALICFTRAAEVFRAANHINQARRVEDATSRVRAKLQNEQGGTD